jgi:hypothetical protein
MKKLVLVPLTLLMFSCCALAQINSEYVELVKKAFDYYEAKDYKRSAETFSKAFAANGSKAMPEDRYNAACSWALAGNKDSAFYQLNRIATKSAYVAYNHMATDADLTSLYTDPRWLEITAMVLQNKEKAEANYNKPVVAILDTVLTDDQAGRNQLFDAQKKYGYDAKEVQDLWKQISYKDSIDLIKVEAIIDKYGWMGPEQIGGEGNQTLFLVIQHSPHDVQEHYLPVMRDAVKNHKADASSLALLEDRVALGEGKKQIYGSQVRSDAAGHFWVSPLEDPDHVDERRASAGLGPLSDYLKNWNITWDAAQYKKDLPEIEKKERSN